MEEAITTLCYQHTNTYFVRGQYGGLLIDTDGPKTLSLFFKAIKNKGILLTEITYILATHYHPDHIGLISQLMKLGIQLLVVDVQYQYVHFADELLKRDRNLMYEPIFEKDAVVIRCAESRTFLSTLGIEGEIVSTPSHSSDSISLILDDGSCIVGDLEPVEYQEAYVNNDQLQKDWKLVMQYHPRVIYYGHANMKYWSSKEES
ncbi:MAG: MBL fold metallo-hydrolase [Prevotella sp.]|nr:MBL fold metallo-hydrolase [Staphylococcus sp.]MCM1349834.1 MBL fold metallo-hydrolase [Prevotella sp.]